MMNIRKILNENDFSVDNKSIILSEGIRVTTHWYDIVLIKIIHEFDRNAIKQILKQEGYIVRDELYGFIEVDWNRYFDCEKFENRLG